MKKESNVSIIRPDLTFLVTGATSKVGAAVACALASSGMNLVLHGRDYSKVEALREHIFMKHGRLADILMADFGSVNSIRQGVARIRERHSKLDGILFLSAVYKSSWEPTNEGLESMFAHNYLSSFILIDELLGLIKRSSSPRIVFSCHSKSRRFDFEYLNARAKFHAISNFGFSQMCLHILARTLNDRLKKTNIHTAVIVAPVMTNELFFRDDAFIRQANTRTDNTTVEMINSIVRLLMNDMRRKTNNICFDSCLRPAKYPPFALEKDVQDRLWTISEAMCQQPTPSLHDCKEPQYLF